MVGCPTVRPANGKYLPAGARLPASRDLARQLGMARHGIVEAYDELIADGLLTGRGRHGTFVATSAVSKHVPKNTTAQTPALWQRLPLAVPPTSLTARSKDWRLGGVNIDTLALETWRSACREAGRHLPPQGYGDARGDANLREAIAHWLNEQRSLSVHADHIVVTHGTGQALALLAHACLTRGDICAVEDPGYLGANRAFVRAGAGLHHVPVDTDGIVVSQIVSARPIPRLVHVTPAHQYPLGGRLSGTRRRALLDLAHAHGMLVVENEYDSEFHYAGTH